MTAASWPDRVGRLGFIAAAGLGVGPQGLLYVADTLNHRIQVLTADLRVLFTFGTPGAGPLQFNQPYAVAIGAPGVVCVADTLNHRIQVVRIDPTTRQATFVMVWGGEGRQPGEFQVPTGVAIGANGQVYVADCDHDRVQAFVVDLEEKTATLVASSEATGSGKGLRTRERHRRSAG